MTENIKKIIKRSAEYKYYRYNLVAAVVVTIFILLCIGIPAAILMAISYQEEGLRILLIGIIVPTLFVPGIIYYNYRVKELFKDSKEYIFQKVFFKESHPSWYRFIYFTIQIQDENGQTKMIDTKKVFYTHPMSFGMIRYDVVNNKENTVGYNKKTGMIITVVD